jgi:DNA primase
LKASLRGIDLILEEGMNVKILTFPQGEDPDSFAKKANSEQLIEYINTNELDFVLFKTRLLSEEAKSDPLKKIDDDKRHCEVSCENSRPYNPYGIH